MIDKIKKKIKIEDLYFEVPMRGSGSYEEWTEKTGNLFGSMRVLYSVALYRSHKKQGDYIRVKEQMGDFDGLLFALFGDTWGRYEYDLIRNGKKTSTYDVAVVPNKEILLDMVKKVPRSSADAWLRKWYPRKKVKNL